MKLPSRYTASDAVRTVAPLAGAWIEIDALLRTAILLKMSLPSRERGLKYAYHVNRPTSISLSLPSRERGLKYVLSSVMQLLQHASLPSRERGLKLLSDSLSSVSSIVVAPLAGAWIEISYVPMTSHTYHTSLPSRERGLKLRLTR